MRSFLKLSLAPIIKALQYISRRTSEDAESIQSRSRVYRVLRERAANTSADYIEQHLERSMLFPQREQLWDFALSKTSFDGIFAEFGVFEGVSINHFGKALADRNVTIYGFDSFEGLNEDWTGNQHVRGYFDLKGKMPSVLSNVQLIKGWFNVSVPPFLAEHGGRFSFIHFDADTYESTAFILGLLKGRITKDTILVFDEYLGYPNWKNGEYLAWQEFVTRESVQYEYLGFSNLQAAIRVL